MNRPRSLRFVARTLVAVLSAIVTVLGVAVLAVPAAAADPVATETTLTVVPEHPEYGGPMTLTAEVSSGGVPVDAGTVEFTAFVVPMMPGGMPVELSLGVQPVEGGVAELQAEAGGDSMPGLMEGQFFYVDARYSGVPDELYGSDSNSVLVVPGMDPGNGAPTTTTVTGPSTATVGVATELTATVSPSWAVGFVEFRVDGAPVGPPVEVEAGEALLEHTFTEPGGPIVTAAFTPANDQEFEGSMDASGLKVTVSVGAAVETTTTVTGPSAATVGVATELTATVSPSWAVGYVEFWVDGDVVQPVVEVQGGEAVLEHTFTEPGDPIVTAMFLPDNPDVFVPSEDPAGVQVTVSEAAPAVETTTTVTAPSGATVGVGTELTAEVSPTDAEGSVQFSVDGEEVGDPVEVDEGAASASYTFTSVGTSTVTAAFTPEDADAFEASEDETGKTVIVSPPPAIDTTTTVTGPTSATVGLTTNLAATISPAEAAGSVQFSVNGTPVGDPVAVAGGSASLSHVFAVAGSRTVTAVFTPTDADAFEASADETGVTLTVAAPPPVATTTTLAAPSGVTALTATTFAAVVSPASAVGTVQFSVGGSTIGAPVPVVSGQASTKHTPATSGQTSVTAVFTPTDAGAYVGSTATLPFPVAKARTAVSITGPDEATAGEEATLRAAVTPAGVGGTVTFLVDGARAATAKVADGRAAAPYTFDGAGTSSVTAAFEPTATDVYASSTSETSSVKVAVGPTAAATDDAVASTRLTLKLEQSCTWLRTEKRAEPTGLFGVFTVQFTGAVTRTSTYFTRFTITSCLEQRTGRARAPKPTTVRVPCEATAAGLRCPFEAPADYASLTFKTDLPLPASAAGRRLNVTSSVDKIDPVTGAVTTLKSSKTVVKVPKRTALTASLAPARKKVSSVRWGKAVAYRVTVRNAGIITARGVRVCASLSKGATVRSGKGLTVRGRKACWTVPSVRKGKATSKTLTLVAPPRKGAMRIRLMVTPKKSQASPVRLTAKLPVR